MAAGPQGDLVHPTWPANFAATLDKCVIPVAYIDKEPDPIDGSFRLALARCVFSSFFLRDTA